jgi:hypothetical protein
MANGIVLTNVGEDWAAQRLAGSGSLSSNAGTHIGASTGTTTPAKSDTALATAEVETRGTTTISVTGSGSTAKYQAVGIVNATGTRAITEVGLFSASTSGSMFVRCVHDAINVVNGDSIQYTITIDPA